MFNLIRGGGLKGITALKAVNGNIIRPIIEVEKKDILKYLNKNNIEYIIDWTNSENIYTRNLIRNKLIPECEEINPNFQSNFAGNIDLMAEDID